MACIRSYQQKYSCRPKSFTGNFQRREEIRCSESCNRRFINPIRRRQKTGKKIQEQLGKVKGNEIQTRLDILRRGSDNRNDNNNNNNSFPPNILLDFCFDIPSPLLLDSATLPPPPPPLLFPSFPPHPPTFPPQPPADFFGFGK